MSRAAQRWVVMQQRSKQVHRQGSKVPKLLGQRDLQGRVELTDGAMYKVADAALADVGNDACWWHLKEPHAMMIDQQEHTKCNLESFAFPTKPSRPHSCQPVSDIPQVSVELSAGVPRGCLREKWHITGRLFSDLEMSHGCTRTD